MRALASSWIRNSFGDPFFTDGTIATVHLK
jgi:hypothetical protein